MAQVPARAYRGKAIDLAQNISKAAADLAVATKIEALEKRVAMLEGTMAKVYHIVRMYN